MVPATLRRAATPEPERTVLRFEAIEVDLAARRVSRNGVSVHLTRTEYGLLEAFVTSTFDSSGRSSGTTLRPRR